MKMRNWKRLVILELSLELHVAHFCSLTAPPKNIFRDQLKFIYPEADDLKNPEEFFVDNYVNSLNNEEDLKTTG